MVQLSVISSTYSLEIQVSAQNFPKEKTILVVTADIV